jgi:PAS domain S-box-containing protein
MLQNGPETYFPTIISEIKGFAIFIMDVDGIISTWNIGCELMKGYKAEEAIGQNYNVLFPQFLKDEGLPEREIKIARETGRYETENWRRMKTGQLFWAHVVLTRITDEEGNLVGYVKITQDQSEKKKFQDQLHSKIEDFKRLNAELNNFVFTASHDLKAPINNIEGLALLLKEELKTEAASNEYLNNIVDLMQKSVLKFKSLITDMAIPAVSETENYTYQSFKDITDEIKSLLVNDIENTQVIFHEDYSEAPFIRYPKKHIRSILHNLITNAIKYRSPLRKPEITIKTINSANGFTLVEVSDNGIGIKEEDKNKDFSMYHRLEEGKNEEGTGVGLGLVAKIVDQSYGRIEIDSTVNEGSTFKVYVK